MYPSKWMKLTRGATVVGLGALLMSLGLYGEAVRLDRVVNVPIVSTLIGWITIILVVGGFFVLIEGIKIQFGERVAKWVLALIAGVLILVLGVAATLFNLEYPGAAMVGAAGLAVLSWVYVGWLKRGTPLPSFGEREVD
jgi:hypothetical protein